MEMQDLQGKETSQTNENPLYSQFRGFENVGAKDLQGNETSQTNENPQYSQFRSYENGEAKESRKSPNHGQETASNGKMSQVKTALLVLCMVVTIACASATIILFAKVMSNEKARENGFSQRETLSTNFNDTSFQEKVDRSLKKVEARLEKIIKNSNSELQSLKENVDKKQGEVGARLNDTDNSISKLRRILLVESCAQTSMNGVYTLTSGGRDYCSNGWTIFQRRKDGSIPDFHTKTWEQYSQGFGTLTGEFWLGLRKLHDITRHGGCRLRVDLQSFDNDRAYAEYSQFSVANERNSFRLTVGDYNGTAGDSLNPSTSRWIVDGMAFSTNDRDHDGSSANCATYYHSGGWWNNDCSDAAPNGLYGETRSGGRATMWWTWKGYAPMKFIEMGVRCDQTLL